MGLIMCVSLLLLTPEILSLLFDPQDNVFLSWAQSYVASTISLTAGSAERPPLHQWKAFHVDISTSMESLSPSLKIPSTTIACDASS